MAAHATSGERVFRLRERDRNGLAKPGGSAGYQCDFAVESERVEDTHQ